MSMTPEQIELAKRLAAHPRWLWVDGTYAATDDPNAKEWGRLDGDAPTGHRCDAWHYPALDDPATCGGLLAMVDWPLSIHCANEGSRFVWSVLRHGTILASDEEDLGTALAKALLAQWGETGV